MTEQEQRDFLAQFDKARESFSTWPKWMQDAAMQRCATFPRHSGVPPAAAPDRLDAMLEHGLSIFSKPPAAGVSGGSERCPACGYGTLTLRFTGRVFVKTCSACNADLGDDETSRFNLVLAARGVIGLGDGAERRVEAKAAGLTWCHHCGEGVTDFCRGKSVLCPKGLRVIKKPDAGVKEVPRG